MKWVDITHNFDGQTPVYPGDLGTSLIKQKSIENDRYNAYVLRASLHTGTHIDVPMHLLHDTRMAKDFSVDRFSGNGVFLDVRNEKVISMKPEYRGRVREDDVVLLYTGCDTHFHEKEYFTNHPVVGEDFAEFVVGRKIKMLGMDLPSPDPPPFSVHKALLQNGIFLLENLANLGALVGMEKFEVIALPLKISAEASPVRAVCREI